MQTVHFFQKKHQLQCIRHFFSKKRFSYNLSCTSIPAKDAAGPQPGGATASEGRRSA